MRAAVADFGQRPKLGPAKSAACLDPLEMTLGEAEQLPELLQQREAGFLQPDVVVRIHRIQAYHFVPIGQEAPRHMEANESRCARD